MSSGLFKVGYDRKNILRMEFGQFQSLKRKIRKQNGELTELFFNEANLSGSEESR